MKVTKTKEACFEVEKTGIARNISAIMADREMDISTLHEKTGIGVSKLKMICSDYSDKNGNKRLPNTDELLLLASALNVSPYKLLTGNDDENHVVCEELKLSNDAINTIKELPESSREAIEILLRNKHLLFHLYHYFHGDFTRMTFNVSPIDTEEADFSTLDLQSFNGLSPDDIERLERLRLMDEIASAREKERGQRK